MSEGRRVDWRGTPRERFEAQVDRDGPGGCWLWKGALTPEGYGQLSIKRKAYMVHRWAFEEFVRALDPGVVIDHLCRVRNCVNPIHLDPVTNRENVLRGMSPTAVVRRQGVCKRGHHIAGDNVYTPPSRPNARWCRRCSHESRRRRHDAAKAVRQ